MRTSRTLLQDVFREEGIGIVTNARVTQVEGKSGDAVKLHAVQGESEILLEGSHLLVASGRTPNTQGIGLELAGVETTERGFVRVNERLETTAPTLSRWATAREVPTSPISPSTISESCATISPAAIE